MSAPAPPRLAIRLLEALLPEESRDVLIGDLTESWQQAGAHGPGAYLRFWHEAVTALFALQIVPDHVSAYVPSTRESRMQSFLADLRQAVRVLSRARGFTLLCVGTLGLAIGATTAIVSIANPLLLQAVPYDDADRLVMVNERGGDGRATNVGYATYADLRRDSRSLQRSAAFGSWEPTVFGEHDAERLRGLRVSWEYFRTLGVRPVIGRDFLASDDTPDHYNVVILGHGLWNRRFAADPGIIGKTVDLGDTRPVVIGVMPASFENVLDPTSQIWRALGYDAQDWACRDCRHLKMVGRLRDGTTHAAAGSELEALMQRMASQFPTVYVGAGAVVERLQDRVTQNTRTIFVAVLGAVTLLLLIAVANVVNLQLARAARRDGEFAVRAALGAGRSRIARQLFSEGLVIAIGGGVAGVVIAALALPTLVAQLPASLPRLASIRLDWQVLALVAFVVLLVAVVMGMVPALQAGRRGLFDAIRGGARSGGGGTPHHRTRAGLVVAEVALAMMLLVGASLLGRSLVRLLSVDMGFDPSGLITMEVQATGTAYETAGQVYGNHDRIREAVRAVPGVIDVGLTSQLPLGGNFDRYGLRDRDNLPTEPSRGTDADRYAVSWDYMRAMRIPVVRGRAFTEAESLDSTAHVTIVSDALARRMWPGGDAIGKYIRIGGGDDRPYFQVIGIAGNARHTGLDETVTQQVYVPERQWYWPEQTIALVVRVSGSASRAIPAVREAVRSVDPLQPISRVATMDQVVARSTGQRRLGVMLFTAFGGMALLLAAAGIYGVLAGAVAERTREFGVRTALGATPRSIVSLVLRQGVVLAGTGLLLGAGGAFALSGYLRSLLFGVEANDPVAMLVGASAILLVALAACFVPAHRATSVDPASALRSD
ncbi:MAG: ABC transporter permease [Gemmatimonadaceae bacterium]